MRATPDGLSVGQMFPSLNSEPCSLNFKGEDQGHKPFPVPSLPHPTHALLLPRECPAFWKDRGAVICCPCPCFVAAVGKGLLNCKVVGFFLSHPHPPGWQRFLQFPPLHGFCRSLWLSGACCRGCRRGRGHAGGGGKRPSFRPTTTLQCLTGLSHGRP